MTTKKATSKATKAVVKKSVKKTAVKKTAVKKTVKKETAKKETVKKSPITIKQLQQTCFEKKILYSPSMKAVELQALIDKANVPASTERSKRTGEY